jgi:hypothetical protein
VPEHDDPIDEAEQLFELGEHDEDADPPLREIADEFDEVGFARDIDAGCWLIEQQHVVRLVDPLGEDNLLGVAATEVLDGRIDGRSDNPELSPSPVREQAFPSDIQESEPARKLTRIRE